MILHDDPLCTLLLGDCVEEMAKLPAESIDAVVTDPPAGISFMGKGWDHHKGGREQWVAWMTGVMGECYRVLKPGHWIVVWAMPRRQHWTALAIEDAGFRITDVLLHCFASGFPKGKGQLKPAYEPWILAKKPGLMVPLGIDECRIGTEPTTTLRSGHSGDHGILGSDARTFTRENAARWPANLLLTADEDGRAIFDGDTPGVVGGGSVDGNWATTGEPREGQIFGWGRRGPEPRGYGDSGTYSRFFLIPKASRADREPLVRGEATMDRVLNSGSSGRSQRDGEWVETHSEPRKRQNGHPTVKPLDLMRHLVRLVTPPGGTVLDPFLGSGTTAIAANSEGFRCIGIEKEREYLDIALARMQHQPLGLGLDVAAPTRKRTTPSDAKMPKARWPKATSAEVFAAFMEDEVPA